MDPSIYAGGSLCEFSRASYPEVMMKKGKNGLDGRAFLRHEGYNSSEIGKSLAT